MSVTVHRVTRADRERLAREYAWLARTIALRAACSWEDREELIGDAMLGLAKAIRGYDPARERYDGASFKAYARTRILGAIIDGRRQRDPVGRQRRHELLAGATPMSHEQDTVRLEHAPHAADEPDLDQRIDLKDAIAQLPARERLIIILHDLEGVHLAELGRLLGVNESRVSQIARQARDRLRQSLDR